MHAFFQHFLQQFTAPAARRALVLLCFLQLGLFSTAGEGPGRHHWQARGAVAPAAGVPSTPNLGPPADLRPPLAPPTPQAPGTAAAPSPASPTETPAAHTGPRWWQQAKAKALAALPQWLKSRRQGNLQGAQRTKPVTQFITIGVVLLMGIAMVIFGSGVEVGFLGNSWVYKFLVPVGIALIVVGAVILIAVTVQQIKKYIEEKKKEEERERQRKREERRQRRQEQQREQQQETREQNRQEGRTLNNDQRQQTPPAQVRPRQGDGGTRNESLAPSGGRDDSPTNLAPDDR